MAAATGASSNPTSRSLSSADLTASSSSPTDCGPSAALALEAVPGSAGFTRALRNRSPRWALVPSCFSRGRASRTRCHRLSGGGAPSEPSGERLPGIGKG